MADTPHTNSQRTEILLVRDLDHLDDDAHQIERAATLIRQGKLVAFPTETVYGLGADATNVAAVAGIFAAKERPRTDPLIVHLADDADMARVASSVPAAAERLAERFWPGPLTLVVPRAPLIPALVAAGGATVGVRVPAHPVARALIRAAGVPIAAPSANRFMHTSPTTAAHVLADLDGRIAAILDAGPCPVGVESTVVDLTSDPPLLLRPGGITLEMLRTELPTIALPARHSAPIDQASESPGAATDSPLQRAPGQMERHYAPQARMIVFDGVGMAARQAVAAEVAAGLAAGERVGALVPDEEEPTLREAGAEVMSLGPAADLPEIARRLYGGLRALDAAGVDCIVAHTFGEAGLGLALSDRLRRAAGGRLRQLPSS